MNELLSRFSSFLIKVGIKSIRFYWLQLRQRVAPYITESYMKEDLHLLRWLRGEQKADMNLGLI